MYENSRLLKRILIYLLIIQQHLTNSINNLDRMQKDREILENLPKKNKTYQLKQRLYNKKFIKEMKKYLKICNRFIKNMQCIIDQDQRWEKCQQFRIKRKNEQKILKFYSIFQQQNAKI